MAHFRGIVKNDRGTVSRMGTKKSGLEVEAQSYQGKVTVWLRHDAKTGCDMVRVELDKHEGSGVTRVLYDGPVSGQGHQQDSQGRD